MQPLETLLPAVYAVLTTPALVWEEEEVRVFEHLPNKHKDARYILLSQPTATPSSGSTACRLWECTVLIDCVSLFTPGFVSSAPADALASLVFDRLEGVQFPLTGGWALSGRSEVQQILGGNDALDGEQIDIHRYLRFRFSVYKRRFSAPPLLPSAPILNEDQLVWYTEEQPSTPLLYESSAPL